MALQISAITAHYCTSLHITAHHCTSLYISVLVLGSGAANQCHDCNGMPRITAFHCISPANHLSGAANQCYHRKLLQINENRCMEWCGAYHCKSLHFSAYLCTKYNGSGAHHCKSLHIIEGSGTANHCISLHISAYHLRDWHCKTFKGVALQIV